jgi:AmmeMemoRadiSam system protein A
MSSTDTFTNESTSNTEPGTGLCEEEHILLRKIAFEAVEFGLKHGKHLPIETSHYPTLLQNPGTSFVTLKKAGELRGCIGSLEAHQPLVNDVAHNAYAAAFMDPRFQPVSGDELKNLEFHISVLTPAIAMDFDSEDDLLKQIRPGIDGLLLEDGQHRGTFLPAVWESLPDTENFLQHLKQKAGLPQNYWSESIKIFRYTTESF